MRVPSIAKLAPVASVSSLVLSPTLAHACAVCGGGTDRMRVAFLISTAFLSLLPLALIFGGLWWLRRSGAAMMRDEFMDRDEVPVVRVERYSSPAPIGGAEQPASS